MHIVYVLNSLKNPTHYYTGHTDDVTSRLEDHNRGGVFHTAKWKPWKVVVAVHFADKRKAILFERYLKSGSGRAFAKRHF